jgi:FSR family fosmidomycin resistance protein-like MFS transporter
MVGGELARTIGPLVILGAISLWKLEGTYRLLPLGLLASIILYFRLQKLQIVKKKEVANKASIKPGLKKLAPLFLTIAGIIFFRAGLKAALTIYLPTYMSMKGASLWIAGGALSILQLAGAGGTFLSGTISDKLGRKNTLLIIALANPLLLWLFIHVKGILVFPVLILNGFFLIASSPVILALIHDRDSGHPSLVNGIYMTISFVLSSIMIMAVGTAVDRYGLDLTYKMAAIAAIGTIPCVVLLKEKKGELK